MEKPKPLGNSEELIQKGVDMVLQALSTDDRRGMISCSSLARIFACPASFNLEKFVKTHYPDKSFDTDDSRRGDRLHKAMQTFGTRNQDLSDVKRDEVEFLEFCHSKFLSVLKDYAQLDADSGVFVERRLWAGGVLSGQIDKAIVSEKLKRAEIFDWKFGTQPVPPAAENLQMAGYALLAFENFEVDTVVVHIVSPCAFGKKYSSVAYTREMEPELSRQITIALAKAYKEDAPYASDIGAHCQFCIAKTICKKQLENCTAIMNNDQQIVLSPQDFSLTIENFDQITEKLNICSDRIKAATRLIEQLKEAHYNFARDNIENLPNYEFKAGSESFKVDDMAEFLQSLHSRIPAIDEAKFLKFLSVSKSAMDEMVKTEGKIKAKDLKDFYRILNGCHFEQGKEKLVRKKEVK